MATPRSLHIAALAIAALTSQVAGQTTSASGRVLVDSTEVPVPGATVAIPTLRIATTTDSLGRFSLSGVRSGDQVFVVRRLGYAPFSTVINIAPGEPLDADFLLKPIVRSLENVNVVGARVSPKLAEFEERRAFGIGHFMTAEDFERQNTTRVSTSLAKLPGLVLVRANAGGDIYVGSTRGAQSVARGNGGRPCPADVFLDGSFVGTGPDLDKLLQKTDIAAVEWYAGAAQMPVKYGGTKRGCAVLVIWTH